jgi:hypothetical protein
LTLLLVSVGCIAVCLLANFPTRSIEKNTFTIMSTAAADMDPYTVPFESRLLKEKTTKESDCEIVLTIRQLPNKWYQTAESFWLSDL